MQKEGQSNHRAPFVSFDSLKGPGPAMLVAQCLKAVVSYMHCTILLFFRWKESPIVVTRSLLEAEALFWFANTCKAMILLFLYYVKHISVFIGKTPFFLLIFSASKTLKTLVSLLETMAKRNSTRV